VIDKAVRRVMPRVSGGLIRLYTHFGFSPNQISMIGFGFAAFSAWAVALGAAKWAIGLWWVGRIFDGTDGIYARATGRATPFGAYLDIVLDMAAYALMIVGFHVAHPDLAIEWLSVVGLYVLCITTALALGAQEAAVDAPARDDRGLRLGAGLAEAGETGIAYTLFLLFPAVLASLVHLWIAVLMVTVVARTLLAYRLLMPR
jgi:phosphatidylglycerophosphate synthase